jgi:hypothetical protein
VKVPFLASVREDVGVAKVTRDEALGVAKAEADRRGWPWIEPVRASGGWLSYKFMTNASKRGVNVNVRVRARDGKVLRAAFARR